MYRNVRKIKLTLRIINFNVDEKYTKFGNFYLDL